MRNWVVLKILNASARNSSSLLSLTLKCLSSAMSKFKRCGLFRKFLPALPKVSPRGATNCVGLANRGPKLCELFPGLTVPGMTSGYEATVPIPPRTPALSVSPMPVLPASFTTLKGVPDWNRVIPDHSQPSNRVLAQWELPVEGAGGLALESGAGGFALESGVVAEVPESGFSSQSMPRSFAPKPERELPPDGAGVLALESGVDAAALESGASSQSMSRSFAAQRNVGSW